MKLKNVLLATKQTELEYYRQNYDKPEDVLPQYLLEEKKKSHDEHYASFGLVKKILDDNNISYQRVYMPYGAYEEFVGRDLVISVGGDGTVLNAAHYILDNTPLLTVKSEGSSTGALCKINAFRFRETLQKILNDDFSLESWTRVEGKFGHKTDIALNEVSVRQEYDGMARYSVKFNDISETQNSSKILISTGAGSTALYDNVKHSQGKFDPRERELRFVVSEDIRVKNYKMLHGRIFPGDVIEITSLMDFDGKICFDGDKYKRRYNFPIGQKLYVKISDKPLSVIVPNL
jgi:NAD+ kinase